MRLRFLPAAAAAALALTLVAGPAAAADFVWTAASGLRPDATGLFTRNATGSSTDAFTPEGALRLQSGAHPEYMYYEAQGAQLAMPEQLVLSFRTRLVDSSASTTQRSPLMVAVSFDGGAGAVLKIESNNAAFLLGNDQGATPGSQILPGVFHDYRLTFFGQAAGDAVQLEIDGVARYTYQLNVNPALFASFDRIWFGDGTLLAGGSSDWLAFSHNAAPVPEPAAALLLGGGLGLLAALQRARRRGG